MRQLYDLQELDWEIGRHQAELSGIEARLRDDSALVKARADTVQWEEKVQDLKLRQASQALEVQQWREKLQGLEQRMYGGSVRNPRELESLQAELQYARTHIQEEEDKWLNLMVDLEEGEKRLAKARVDMEQGERAWTETTSVLSKEQATLSRRLAELMSNRQQMASGTPPALLSRYEQVRKASNGHAIAKVERGMCMGCRLTLPTTDLQRVRTSRELVTCNSCGRILYMS